MKVVQVVSGIATESSGPSYSVPGLCRGLHACGVAVELHTKNPRPERSFDFPLITYPWCSRFFKSVGWAPRLYAGLLSAVNSTDIIHSNGLWMFPNVYPAWVAEKIGCKLVVSPRGSLAEWSLKKGRFKKEIFGRLFQNRTLSRVDIWHATSVKEYEEIRAAGYKQPVAIVPIGMEMPNQGLGKRELESGREENRLRQVAFFGRLHKVKAVDRLVRAWELLNQTILNWELVIAGPDCGSRGELEQYIAAHKIPRVRFVGELNGQAKYDFLSAADLYVLPSFTENFGITVAEALACGTPVIVSKGTPWQGVVENRCGWWVENDPVVLAETLRTAMSLSDDKRHIMGENGREWIKRDFSWEGIGAKMKMAYEWLLNPVVVACPDVVRVD